MKNLLICCILFFSVAVFSSGCKKDKNPPVITIIGDNPLIHPLGVPYDDPGATAFDEEDGDITDKIQTEINVDINEQGYNYSVKYNVEDAAGNRADEKVRTVHVLVF